MTQPRPEVHMRGRGQRLGAGPGRDAGGIAEAQRHARAFADDGRNIQAQRARRIEGNAAQQRFALAGVIGQRQGTGRRAGVEFETIQALAGNRDAGPQAQIRIRREGHAGVAAAIGQAQIGRGDRRQKRLSHVR